MPTEKQLANLKPFTKTNQPAAKNKGPKRSKLRAFIKENDLGTKDIQIIARLLIDVPREKLKEIASDPKKPILLSGAATALLKDMAKGKIDTIQWLVDRGFGMAKQVVETTNTEVSVKDLPPGERDILLANLMEKYEKENTGTK